MLAALNGYIPPFSRSMLFPPDAAVYGEGAVAAASFYFGLSESLHAKGRRNIGGLSKTCTSRLPCPDVFTLLSFRVARSGCQTMLYRQSCLSIPSVLMHNGAEGGT
jgi:hypothetical protein